MDPSMLWMYECNKIFIFVIFPLFSWSEHWAETMPDWTHPSAEVSEQECVWLTLIDLWSAELSFATTALCAYKYYRAEDVFERIPTNVMNEQQNINQMREPLCSCTELLPTPTVQLPGLKCCLFCLCQLSLRTLLMMRLLLKEEFNMKIIQGCLSLPLHGIH